MQQALRPAEENEAIMPHTVEIPAYVIERIMAKRGRLNVFDRFHATKTALVVIDMQNFFVADVESAKSICPNINRLAAALRQGWARGLGSDGTGRQRRWPQ